MTEKQLPTELDVNDIMAKLPHRYPLLMIDRIVDIEPGVRATGIKNVTINEQIFQGHFPGHPIFPGVLIIEAMAQTAAAMVVHTLGSEAENKLVYFMTVDEARFRKPVVPGDQMHITVEALRSRGVVWKFKGTARVDGNVHAEAEFSAMLVDKK